MKRRIALAFAALFMLIVFITIILIGAVMALFFLLGYIVTGSEWLRDRLTKFGQGIDSAANVILLDGHPKETISSHVGRMYSAKFGNVYKGMAPTDPDYVLPRIAIIVMHITDIGEPDHVYKAVEEWAVEAKVPL